MVMLFLLSPHIAETVLTVQLEVGWYKSYIQENFVLFALLPFPSFLSPTPAPSPSCLFYSETGPEMTGPRTDTWPKGEPIYRPAEPILLPRAFTYGDRETESACWWMVMAQRSYGVRAGVNLCASLSHMVINQQKQEQLLGGGRWESRAKAQRGGGRSPTSLFPGSDSYGQITLVSYFWRPEVAYCSFY